VKIAKARFNVLWGAAARLERALAQFMLDLHTREHGYTEVWVPHLVNGVTMLKTGQLPKFEEQLFKTVEARREPHALPDPDRGSLALGPAQRARSCRSRRCRAVHVVHAMLSPRGRHLRQGHEGPLPAAPVREGRAREDHEPAQSYDELESLVKNAEECCAVSSCPTASSRLHRRPRLSTAKGYDVEVWLPSQDAIARSRRAPTTTPSWARAEIRYRPAAGGAPVLRHAERLRPRHRAHDDGVLENYQKRRT